MSAAGNLTVMAASTAYSPHSRQNDGSGSTRGVSGQSAMHNHGNRHSSGRPDLEEQVRSADNMGKRQHRVLKSGSAERTIDDPFWMLSADQRDTVSKVPRDAQAGVIKAFLDDNARANAGFLDDITDTSGHDVVTAGVYEEEFQGAYIVNLPLPSSTMQYHPLWDWEKLLLDKDPMRLQAIDMSTYTTD